MKTLTSWYSPNARDQVLRPSKTYCVKLYDKVGRVDSCYVNFERSTTRNALYFARLELVSFCCIEFLEDW